VLIANAALGAEPSRCDRKHPDSGGAVGRDLWGPRGRRALSADGARCRAGAGRTRATHRKCLVRGVVGGQPHCVFRR
jgi:hypothetical protein